MESLDSRWLSSGPRHSEDLALEKGFQDRGHTIPLPHEDFEPYFSQYSGYDSVLGDHLSAVHELNIAGSSPYNPDGASYPSSPPSMLHHGAEVAQLTVKPSSLARYSKMMNYNNVAVTPATMAVPSFAPPLTPSVSPMKSNSSEVFLQSVHHGASSPISLPLSSPSLTYSSSSVHPSSVIYSKDSHPYLDPSSSPIRRRPSVFGESDSEAYFSSSEHSHSPNIDTSPELSSGSQFFTGATPGLASMNVFSSLDMGPTDPSSAIAWQPIITAPKDEDSQEIIKLQQSNGKQSNRKSCLPPGKVDSYMAGPNAEGLFECLFPNCGKFFRRRYNVRSHIQTHLCDRPYGCDVCGACFVRPHDLRRHEKCHQNERPFSCPCGKGFTRHDALQRHRMRMICSGGIETPGKPKKLPARRGRPPRKARSMVQLRGSAEPAPDSDSDHGSPFSDHGLEYIKDEHDALQQEVEVLWSR